MQDLKPDMDRIRAEYKDDVQKQREEMAKLYQERQVNPLGGCLPIFIQLPIFLVLYYTIRHFDTLESFRTGGLLWFQNLTVYDHLFILPGLYILTMMASQELTIRNTATQQKQLMRFLPIIFGVFLARFPTGLFVYWVTSNLITFAQNYVIYYVLPHKNVETEEVKPAQQERHGVPQARSPQNQKERSGQEQEEKEGGKEEITQVQDSRAYLDGLADLQRAALERLASNRRPWFSPGRLADDDLIPTTASRKRRVPRVLRPPIATSIDM